MRHQSSAGLLRLPGRPWRRPCAILSAFSHTYSPLRFALRLISRATVAGWTPISPAMPVLLHPLLIPRYIAYLCCEVSCLYINNAKLIDFREAPASFFVFTLLLDAHGDFASPPLGLPRSVFHAFFASKTLHFYLDSAILSLIQNSRGYDMQLTTSKKRATEARRRAAARCCSWRVSPQ